MAITKNSQIDLNGNEMILDADGDTTITADTDDQIDIKVAGSDKVQINATGLGIGQVPTRDLSLHAGDASSVFAHFTNTDTGTTSSDGLLIGLGSSEDLVLNNQESSKNIIFENGGSERMRIDSSGNVGIGTSSPDNTLHVHKGTAGSVTGNTNAPLTVENSTSNFLQMLAPDANESGILFGNPTNSANAGIVYSGSVGDLQFRNAGNTERMRIDSSGNIGMGGRLSVGTTTVGGGNTKIVATGGTDNYIQLVSNTGTGGVSLGNAGSVFLLYTHTGALGSESFTERMRIDSSGALLVGTTSQITSSTEECVHIKNGDGAGQLFLDNTRSSGSQYMVQIHRLGTRVGSIQTTTTTTSYLGTSDYRVKENVDYEFNALERVAQLKPARFNFIIEPDVTVDGFLAHEVSPVVPEAVSGKKDAVDKEGNPDLQGIDHSKLVPLLTKAIQEQQAQIEALQSEINTLKGG